MAVNMLDPALMFQTSITSDCPCHSDYRPENLGNPSGKGFISASFKRPPVSVTVDFVEPYAVQVQKIVFKPKILSQCCTSVVINVQRPLGGTKLAFLMRASWDADVDYVIFDHSLNYTPNGIIPSNLCKDFHPLCNVKVKEFRMPRHQALHELSSIVFTFTSTKKSSAIALKNFMIFGQPSMKMGRPEYVAFVKNIVRPTPKVPVGTVKASVIAKKGNTFFARNLEVAPAPVFSSKLVIPEDFIDPITLSLIFDPVILPSGVTVDMSTLRHHENAQKEMGRRLFDPFTGSLLTYQEIRSDDVLKVRIMDFYFENLSKLMDECSPEEAVRLKELHGQVEPLVPAPPSPPVPDAPFIPPTAAPSEQTVRCPSCSVETRRGAMYDYPCGKSFCRDCAVSKSFGSVPQNCLRCGRMHGSSDIRRVYV